MEKTLSISDLLKFQYEIMTPSKDLINAVGSQDSTGELHHILNEGSKDAISNFLWERIL